MAMMERGGEAQENRFLIFMALLESMMSKEPEMPHFLLTIERKYHILPLSFVAVEI